MGSSTSVPAKRKKSFRESLPDVASSVVLIDRKTSIYARHTTGNDKLGRYIQLTEEEFKERVPVLTEIVEEGVNLLKAVSVDFHIQENKRAHHTADYDMTELIVRRGQSFDITVAFNRPYNELFDTVLLQFATGSRPQQSKGTVIRIKVSKDPQDTTKKEWEASVKRVEQNDCITYTVEPAATAIVGPYHLSVETQHEQKKSGYQEMRHTISDMAFYLIFNPWCPDDDVYMSSATDRIEYVLNETGRLWIGTFNSQQAVPWNFGQFESVSLKAALLLLHKSDISDEACGNIVHVIRTISAMANSNDNDGGVLKGRWTNTYPKNTVEPWAWTGSVEILEKYMEDGKSVCYGQCWVFSGLVTSLMRALGVGTRSVTNYESAHDTDCSMTIDYHWGEDEKPLLLLNDSVWNFHVWNESYFRRTDLPEGYDGWQAHDATPQQLSAGLMRCGPAPLSAVKEGQAYIPYDSGFVFAEVNGEKIHWLVKSDGSMKPICFESAAIGKCVKTKAVGSCKSVDITDLYKYREGTQEERQAVHNAFTRSSRRKHIEVNHNQDVLFKLKVPHTVLIGSDLKVSLDVENTANENRTAKVCLTFVMTYYTGIPSERILTENYEKKLTPNGASKLMVNVPYASYKNMLMREAIVTVFLKCSVPKSDQTFAHMDTIRLMKPCLRVQVKPEKVQVGEDFELIISFTNSLPHQLKDSVFHIESPGIAGPFVLESKKVLLSQEMLVERLLLKPRRSGRREILVNLSTDMVPGIIGTAEIMVTDLPAEETRRSPRISLFQGPSSLSAVVICARSGSSLIQRQSPIQRSCFSLTSCSACGLVATSNTSAWNGWSSSGSGEPHTILVT
ncbi:Protein-glutamine gamma-glutamyltransferase K [Lamellibrachia satsuma]|nr:Protein-glutamine gamma-glutamyltransferase K [Lamellibrachia satsuma]